MKRVLIVGAGGQIARWAIQMLGERDAISLTLFLRQARRLKSKAPRNARVLEGDVLDRAQLDAAMTGQDLVYANLTGDDIDAQAHSIIASMKRANVERLVFVTSLGIDYETTTRNEAFKGTEVSRKSVADLVVRIIDAPERFSRTNLGVNKPNTDGDKPAFM